MVRREAAKSDMANRGCGFAIECTDVAPALSFGVVVLDAVTDASDPIPAKRFDIAKPRATKAGVGNDNRMALCGHHLMESAEKLAMGTGTVVAAQGMNFFLHRDGAPADGYGGFEDKQFTAELTIAPIDDDDGALSARKEHGAEWGVDSLALLLQMRIPEQAVNGLDVVFNKGVGAARATEMGQGEFPAVEQGFNDPQECGLSGAVADDGIAFEPRIQQANGVHAALSDSEGGVVTTIRSDGSVHVDPLSFCFQMTNRQKSWGYLSKALQRMRISMGCFPCRYVRGAERGR